MCSINGTSIMVGETTLSVVRVRRSSSGLWDVPESVGILGWFPFEIEITLSPFKTILSSNDFLINSEIWNWV
jgi:hypothetical protein